MFALWIRTLGGCMLGDAACPDGATTEGSAPPDGLEVRCVDGGVAHGPFTRWHTPAQVAARGRYERGRPVGLFQEWSPIGILTSEVSYVDGERDGLARTWSEAGQLLESTHHAKGVREGTYERFEAGARVRWGASPPTRRPGSGESA